MGENAELMCTYRSTVLDNGHCFVCSCQPRVGPDPAPGAVAAGRCGGVLP